MLKVTFLWHSVAVKFLPASAEFVRLPADTTMFIFIGFFALSHAHRCCGWGSRADEQAILHSHFPFDWNFNKTFFFVPVATADAKKPRQPRRQQRWQCQRAKLFMIRDGGSLLSSSNSSVFAYHIAISRRIFGTIEWRLMFVCGAIPWPYSEDILIFCYRPFGGGGLAHAYKSCVYTINNSKKKKNADQRCAFIYMSSI